MMFALRFAPLAGMLCLFAMAADARVQVFGHYSKRDASTQVSGGNNNEGEAHSPIVAPPGSTFVPFPVGGGANGQQVATFWTQNPNTKGAKHAFIMIHGKQRDGATYWTTMNDILLHSTAQTRTPHAAAIVVAPQFFSARYNSGQYAANELAWGDVNGWQAGDAAVQPPGTKLTSLDVLDALVATFLDTTTYPSMTNITIVGHGGGGQLTQRYAMVGKTFSSNVHIRYIHSDPSSCAYFTTDRPTMAGVTLPSKASCPLYNTWRYGLDNFTETGYATATAKTTAQQLFTQYVRRDVVSIVGYQDVSASGDDYCMAQMQGGIKRRDRNLIWWRYINMLARTNENIDGFPGSFVNLPDWSSAAVSGTIATRLIVVENATHSAKHVFESDEGQAALFSNSNALPTGWRPAGWTASVTSSAHSGGASGTNTSSTSAADELRYPNAILSICLLATITLLLWSSS